MNTKVTLGIDISKKRFDVALLRDSKLKQKKFDNTPKGFVALEKWLAFHKVTDVQVSDSYIAWPGTVQAPIESKPSA